MRGNADYGSGGNDPFDRMGRRGGPAPGDVLQLGLPYADGCGAASGGGRLDPRTSWPWRDDSSDAPLPRLCLFMHDLKTSGGVHKSFIVKLSANWLASNCYAVQHDSEHGVVYLT